MAIKLKAIERNVSFEKDVEKWAFVLSTELYNKLSESKVIQEAALRSGVSKGVMQACWDAAGDVIKAWATEGHSVAIPGLGTMRFGVRAKSVETVDKVATGIITSRRVIFTPSVDIKQALKQTAINITCYDRDGNVIKNVTSGDSGEVEDPEGNDPNCGGSTQGGQQQTGGDNTQSGSNTTQGSNTNQGSGSTNPPVTGGESGDDGFGV